VTKPGQHSALAEVDHRRGGYTPLATISGQLRSQLMRRGEIDRLIQQRPGKGDPS
jgi:hypothetical protein